MNQELSPKTATAVSIIERIAIIIMMCGLIILPIHLRFALLKESLDVYGRINYIFLLALALFALAKIVSRKVAKLDIFMLIIWTVCTGLFLYSDQDIDRSRVIVAFCLLILPITLIIYRFVDGVNSKALMVCMVIFDVFVLMLLACAIVEKFCGDIILSTVIETVNSSEYETYYNYATATDVWRFFSVWGHALTNAMFFTSFFIINDAYFYALGKRYPKFLFFAISMVGVALCASKTAIVVVLLYMIVTCVKNGKKLLIAGAVLLIVFFAIGGFDMLITRFTTLSLTSGRIETITRYFQDGINPLQWIKGYGTNFVYTEDMRQYKAGFEFPLLMAALDHGITFSILFIGGLYIYASYVILKAKNVLCWFGYSLIYAELSTYNAMTLTNQDCFIWACLYTMLMVNVAKRQTPELEVEHE